MTGIRDNSLRNACATKLIAFCFAFALFSSLLAISVYHPSYATESASNRKVLVIIVDRIGIEDISPSSTPNLLRLSREGSLALMNARIKNDPYGIGGYVVIGAGGRAQGSPGAPYAFNKNEILRVRGSAIRAGDIYYARTSRVPPDESVVNISIEEMKSRSGEARSPSTPGLLGEALKEAGLKTSVLGNSDLLTQASTSTQETWQVPPDEEEVQPIEAHPFEMVLHREASCIAMDETGIVASGDVSSHLYTTSPGYGVRTNFENLLKLIKRELRIANFIVVDTGDMSRLDEQAQLFNEKALKRAKTKTLKDCDKAIGEIEKMLNLKKDLLIVCTPTPSRKMIEQGKLLTPLVICGPEFKWSRIYSPTTRRHDIVSNMDIAPTILKFFGLTIPKEMEGSSLEARHGEVNVSSLNKFLDRASSIYSSRKTMVRIYVFGAMIVIAFLILLAFLRPDIMSKWNSLATFLFATILSAPLAYLIAPSIAGTRLPFLIPSIVIIASFVSLLAIFTKGRGSSAEEIETAMFKPICIISFATLAALLVDTLISSPLMTISPFGSSVILGDRYYGIGNLYMGFAVGASILFICSALSIWRKSLNSPRKRYIFAASVIIPTIVIIGFQRFGANLGGLLTAITASTVTLALLRNKRMSIKKVIVIILMILVITALFVAIDLLLPGPSSHAGRAISKDNGLSSLIKTVGRKLQMNLNLIESSTWRFLLVLILACIFLLEWRFGIIKRLRIQAPSLYAGIIGLSVAAVVALIFNDSGIEPASAICTFAFVPCFIYLYSTYLPPLKGRNTLQANENRAYF